MTHRGPFQPLPFCDSVSPGGCHHQVMCVACPRSAKRGDNLSVFLGEESEPMQLFASKGWPLELPLALVNVAPVHAHVCLVGKGTAPGR